MSFEHGLFAPSPTCDAFRYGALFALSLLSLLLLVIINSGVFLVQIGTPLDRRDTRHEQNAGHTMYHALDGSDF